MSLSIGLPASFVSISGSTGAAVSAPSADTEKTEEQQAAGLEAGGSVTASTKKSNSGLGQVVDTLVDRLSELHERLRRLRQELRAAISSPQPDIVRLPRILSLQRQVMVTNSDIQLVSGLLISSLSKTTAGISTRA